ncbi:Lcl C-terminal domain-containing protein [Nitrospina watsonii]|uniref:Lcl C-terminal domain-containing protein n=1 Tax=Nitrospina watsonii TaxID=1323948 RepID=A0ABM9HFH7_9BACT|nr:DUF1566 domain-containing protein [Nitrospina watsonii]CAI2719087.1 conserved protein of unknown function [Nitrospina watsonii]
MTETKTKVRFVDNGDGTVTDTRKNLMWLKDDSWVQKGHLISWWQSQEFLSEKNEQRFAGFSDWRIPNAHEAKDLYNPEWSNTDMEGCEVHIDPVFTSGCGYTTWTTETRGAKAAMGYDFRADYEYWLAKENMGFPSSVRLVRTVGAENKMPPEERFVDHGDGTISDLEMGLMWKKDDSYLEMDKWVSWDEAKTWVSVLNQDEFAKRTDWRLPTRKEAQSIHDPANPVTDTYGDVIYIPSIFSPGAGQTSWTKTLHKTDPSVAIRFNYFSGDYKFHKKGLRSHGARAVRDLK